MITGIARTDLRRVWAAFSQARYVNRLYGIPDGLEGLLYDEKVHSSKYPLHVRLLKVCMCVREDEEDFAPETEFIIALTFAHLPLSLIPCPSCSYKTPAMSILGQICVHGFGGVGYHVLENFALMLMIIRRCSPEKIPGVFERAIEKGRARERERETEADVHTKHMQTCLHLHTCLGLYTCLFLNLYTCTYLDVCRQA